MSETTPAPPAAQSMLVLTLSALDRSGGAVLVDPGQPWHEDPVECLRNDEHYARCTVAQVCGWLSAPRDGPPADGAPLVLHPEHYVRSTAPEGTSEAEVWHQILQWVRAADMVMVFLDRGLTPMMRRIVRVAADQDAYIVWATDNEPERGVTIFREQAHAARLPFPPQRPPQHIIDAWIQAVDARQLGYFLLSEYAPGDLSPEELRQLDREGMRKAHDVLAWLRACASAPIAVEARGVLLHDGRAPKEDQDGA